MIEDILDKTDADMPTLQAVASYEAARTRIAAACRSSAPSREPRALPIRCWR